MFVNYSFTKRCLFDLSYPVAYSFSSLSLKNRLYNAVLLIDCFDKRLAMHPVGNIVCMACGCWQPTSAIPLRFTTITKVGTLR